MLTQRISKIVIPNAMNSFDLWSHAISPTLGIKKNARLEMNVAMRGSRKKMKTNSFFIFSKCEQRYHQIRLIDTTTINATTGRKGERQRGKKRNEMEKYSLNVISVRSVYRERVSLFSPR